jgi:hypothetical protein
MITLTENEARRIAEVAGTDPDTARAVIAAAAANEIILILPMTPRVEDFSRVGFQAFAYPGEKKAAHFRVNKTATRALCGAPFRSVSIGISSTDIPRAMTLCSGCASHAKKCTEDPAYLERHFRDVTVPVSAPTIASTAHANRPAATTSSPAPTAERLPAPPTRVAERPAEVDDRQARSRAESVSRRDDAPRPRVRPTHESTAAPKVQPVSAPPPTPTIGLFDSPVAEPRRRPSRPF